MLSVPAYHLPTDPVYFVLLIATSLVAAGIVVQAAILYYRERDEYRWIYGLKIAIGLIWVGLTIAEIVDPNYVQDEFLNVGLVRPAVLFTLAVILVRLVSWKRC